MTRTSSHQDRLAAEQAKAVADTWLRTAQGAHNVAIPLGLANRLHEMVEGHMRYVYYRAYRRGYDRGRRKG